MDWGRKGAFSSALILGILLVTLVGVPFPAQCGHILRIQETPSRKILWEKEVSPHDRFTLVHRNSIYGVKVQERLNIESSGIIRLNAIRCENPAVLEYYGLETPSPEWIPMDRRFESFRVFITRKGEFSWEWNGHRLDLSQMVEDKTVVEIRLTFSPPYSY